MTPTELKAWRQAHDHTQTTLAVALGVAISTVARWEIGQREIPSYLDLALDELARREQSIDP